MEEINKLWNEYFGEECSKIDTMEEKTFARRTAEMSKAIDDLLTNEQHRAVDKYIESLYDLQDCLVKKAFFKGCKFTVSFFLAQGKYGAL